MTKKTKTKVYLIGDPEVRAKVKKVCEYIGYAVLALAVGMACWTTGYLLGLTFGR